MSESDPIEVIVELFQRLTPDDRQELKERLSEDVPMCSSCWGNTPCHCWNDE